MPKMAPLVITDDAGNDTHNFLPNALSGGVATFAEPNSVPIAANRMTVSKTSTQNGKHKVQVKLTMPIVQDAVLAGVTRKTVVRTAYADLTFSFDQTSEEAERKHIRRLLAFALSNLSPVSEATDQLTPFY